LFDRAEKTGNGFDALDAVVKMGIKPSTARTWFYSFRRKATGGEGERRVSADGWTVADAKAKLSDLIEQARSNGPQTITRRGTAAVVVVAAEEWERKTRRTGNLAEFFASSPLRGSDLVVERSKETPRKVDL
jgi:prevent-host-death family protein